MRTYAFATKHHGRQSIAAALAYMGIIDWRYCTPQNVRPQFFSSEQDHWFLGPMSTRRRDLDGKEIADEPAWVYDEEIVLQLPGNEGYRKGQKENARAIKFIRLFGDALSDTSTILPEV